MTPPNWVPTFTQSPTWDNIRHTARKRQLTPNEQQLSDSKKSYLTISSDNKGGYQGAGVPNMKIWDRVEGRQGALGVISGRVGRQGD